MRRGPKSGGAGYRRTAAGLLALASILGCLDLSRTVGVGDGAIVLQPLRADGAVALGARGAIPGTGRVADVDNSGTLRVSGLPPLDAALVVVEDDTGDGIAERGAVLTATLVRAAIPRTSTELLFGSDSRVTSAVLGPVTLVDTRSIAGDVVVSDPVARALLPSETALAVVWREVDIGSGDNVRAVALPVEQSAGVSATGAFTVPGVLDTAANGSAHVTVLVWNAAGLYAQGTLPLADGAVADLHMEASPVVDGGGARAHTEVAVELIGAVSAGPLTITATDAVTGIEPDAAPTTFTLDDGTTSVVAALPVGVLQLDVQLDADAGAAGVPGRITGAVVVPGAARSLVPVALADVQLVCDGTDDRHCDRDADGRGGLPTRDAAGAADLYAACAAECADAFGVEAARRVCTVTAADTTRTFDCDDDADGQPDVTEPAACFGAGAGTDLDADDACEPASDPYPSCASNTAADCPAPFTPPPAR